MNYRQRKNLERALSVKLQCLKGNVREDATQMLKWWEPKRRKRKLELMKNEMKWNEIYNDATVDFI